MATSRKFALPAVIITEESRWGVKACLLVRLFTYCRWFRPASGSKWIENAAGAVNDRQKTLSKGTVLHLHMQMATGWFEPSHACIAHADTLGEARSLMHLHSLSCSVGEGTGSLAGGDMQLGRSLAVLVPLGREKLWGCIVTVHQRIFSMIGGVLSRNEDPDR